MGVVAFWEEVAGADVEEEAGEEGKDYRDRAVWEDEEEAG